MHCLQFTLPLPLNETRQNNHINRHGLCEPTAFWHQRRQAAFCPVGQRVRISAERRHHCERHHLVFIHKISPVDRPTQFHSPCRAYHVDGGAQRRATPCGRGLRPHRDAERPHCQSNPRVATEHGATQPQDVTHIGEISHAQRVWTDTHKRFHSLSLQPPQPQVLPLPHNLLLRWHHNHNIPSKGQEHAACERHGNRQHQDGTDIDSYV